MKPKFADMWVNYPVSKSTATVKKMIGGQVDQPAFENTCTIRLSRAFNYSGAPIDPTVYNKKGQPTKRKLCACVSGADGLQYAYRVTEMENYLTKRYGAPDVRVKGADWQKLREAVKGHKGIIMFRSEKWLPSATGHFDIWNGSRARYAQFFQDSFEVCLWELA